MYSKMFHLLFNRAEYNFNIFPVNAAFMKISVQLLVFLVSLKLLLFNISGQAFEYDGAMQVAYLFGFDAEPRELTTGRMVIGNCNAIASLEMYCCAYYPVKCMESFQNQWLTAFAHDVNI